MAKRVHNMTMGAIVWSGGVKPSGSLLNVTVKVGVLLPTSTYAPGQALIDASARGLAVAADEVSDSSTLLPGNFFQLETRIATDTKSLMDHAVALLNDAALFSYIGVYRAYYTEAVHALFRYSQYPQVTFESRSVVLDDRSKYG